MGMIYVPKFPQLTERIGVYGQSGAGKTNFAITMMRRMTNRHFHVFDNNAAYEFCIYEDDERNAKVIAAQNFTIHSADFTDWLDQKARIAEVEAACAEGDWAVFDLTDLAWEAVPAWYTEEFLGLDEMAYRAKIRSALEDKRVEQQAAGGRGDRTAPVFDQLRDWQHINPEYKRTMYATFERLNARGVHVLAVADAKPVSDNDDPAIRKRYRPFKERPAGQKGFTKEMQTVLHLAFDGDDTYTMSTAKDRGSRTSSEKKLDEEPWSDACTTYLSKVAGWHMVKED